MPNIEKLKREKWTMFFLVAMCVFIIYVSDQDTESKVYIFLIMMGAFFISRHEMLSLKIEILKELQKEKTVE